MTKKKLRTELLEKRNSLTAELRDTAAKSACKIVSKSSFFKKATSIAFYVPNKNEFDSLPILQTALKLAKKCYLPVIDADSQEDKKLVFSACDQSTEMKPNKFGILEPFPINPKSIISLESLSLIFMPVVGFDDKGNRLGMGGGYYDSVLSALKPNNRPMLVGLAYDSQRVKKVPSESWDVTMDGILTETEFKTFSS